MTTQPAWSRQKKNQAPRGVRRQNTQRRRITEQEELPMSGRPTTRKRTARTRDGLFQKNEWWWIDYYDAEGKRHRKKAAPDYTTAKIIYRNTMTAIAKGEVLGVREEGTRFQDFANRVWWPRTKARLAPAWADRVKSWCLDAILTPTFGTTKLSKLRKDAVQAWAAARIAKVSASTFNKELWTLRNICKSAVAWGYMKANPTDGVTRVKESKGRVRYLTADERAALLTNANETLRLYILAALHTGGRRGELVRLLWKDVDFRAGTLTFRDTKNGDSRAVPLTATLRQTLQKLTIDVEASVLPQRAPLVLTRAFTRLVARLGLKDLTLHDPRHDAASTLAMAGVPLRTVSEILGHRDMRMTTRYAHLSPQHLRDAMRALDAPPPPPPITEAAGDR
jgi:integrase